MTTFERFERQIPGLMTELAPTRVPDYFDDMLRQTASHRQRPAWSYPERWLPVDIAARPLLMRPFPWRALIVTALVGLLIAAGLVAYIGSRPTLPPPFGAAGNGLLLYRSADGSIHSVDPGTGTQATLAAASEGLGEPVPSRDGRRIAFIPRSSSPASIVVTGIDGSNPTTLAGDYLDIGTVDWAPDDADIAVVADNGGAVTVTADATDGSGATTLSQGRNVRQLWYLPDGRLAMVAADEPGQECPGDPVSERCALFLMERDGSGLARLLAASEFHGLGLHPSPDGTKVVYVEWATGAEGRLHIVDLRDGSDRLLPIEGAPSDYSINRAWFSPDGALILFDLFEVNGGHWAVVPSRGGPLFRIGPEWPGNDAGDALWAPDGRSVLARYPTGASTSELWLLDATGNGADKRLDIDVPYLPTWQRVGTQGAA